MADHALLSPSGASRWLICTPSARLEESFPDSDSEAAREGTLAHSLGENMIRMHYGMITPAEGSKTQQRIMNDPLFTADMLSHMENYLNFVVENYEDLKKSTPDAVLIVEAKLDLTKYIPDSFGTGDIIIIADGVLSIIDLKYGKGVEVSADQNKQMMIYGLGAFRRYDMLYGIEKVNMIIYQPRMSNLSSFTMTAEDLLNWAETELRPKAILAHNGEGEYVPGKHCLFCRVKARCKALANKNLELAKFEFKDPNLLTDAEIPGIVRMAETLQMWVKAVEVHMFSEALKGKKWDGFKLVAGRSNRMYTSQQDVIDTLLDNGFTESQIIEKSLLGITAMEKAITKEKFDLLLSGLTQKAEGKPTLVPAEDKRPEYGNINRAKQDFADIDNEE